MFLQLVLLPLLSHKEAISTLGYPIGLYDIDFVIYLFTVAFQRLIVVIYLMSEQVVAYCVLMTLQHVATNQK